MGDRKVGGGKGGRRKKLGEEEEDEEEEKRWNMYSGAGEEEEKEEKEGKSGEEEVEREKKGDEIEGWWRRRRITCPSICLTLAARSSRPLIEWKGQSVDRGGTSLAHTTCLLIEEAVIRQEAAMALIGWSGGGGSEACRCVISGARAPVNGTSKADVRDSSVMLPRLGFRRVSRGVRQEGGVLELRGRGCRSWRGLDEGVWGVGRRW